MYMFFHSQIERFNNPSLCNCPPFCCAALAVCLLRVGATKLAPNHQQQLSYENLVDQVTTLLEEHPDDLEVARKAMQLQDNINAIYDR